MNQTLSKIFSYKMFVMLLVGYSAGLPLLLIGSTLQAWMKDKGIDLSTIGLVSLFGLPYSLKFLWAPLLDHFEFPFLGRRRGWIIVFQALLVLSIFGLSLVNPKTDTTLLACVCLSIAFFSASQDIVLDAYRREILSDEELGLGSSLYVVGYRLAILVSGSFALYLADNIPFEKVYQWMAVCMAPAILFTFIFPLESKLISRPANLSAAVFGPLKEFFSRQGAITVLFFILLYKVGDSMAANMTTPFILDLGYSKTDMATIGKTFGMISTIIGGVIGGTIMLRTNMKRALVSFGILQAVSTLGFAILPSLPIGFASLASVIAFENLASGMGTAAYAAYMASLTNKQFTATQYALFSALMGVPRTVLASPTGWMSQALGWEKFFIVCTLVAIPGLLLLIPVFRLEGGGKQSTT